MPHLHIHSPLKHSHFSLVEGMGMTHRFPLHTHHSLIIGVVTAGMRRMIYFDDNVVINREQVFIVHPGERHACHPEDLKSVDYRVLCIPADLLQTFFPAGLAFPHVLINPEAAKTILACINHLEDACDETAKEQVLIHFIQKFVTCWASIIHPTALPQAVRQTQQYLDNHMTDKVNIRELGKVASLSPYHLNRLFRRKIGLPPHTYQLQMKIHRAQSLLSQGFSPVETALELGFSDQSHLSRFFKKYVGLTPATYQRQNHKTV